MNKLIDMSKRKEELKIIINHKLSQVSGHVHCSFRGGISYIDDNIRDIKALDIMIKDIKDYIKEWENIT